MWSNCRPGRILVFVLIVAGVGSSPPNESVEHAKAPRFQHASLAAYPNAVISLMDAKTGTVFYVESDGRRVVALDREGRLAWGLDVIETVKVSPKVGKPVVRHLRLEGGRLWATCGKHDLVRIDVATGNAEHAGGD